MTQFEEELHEDPRLEVIEILPEAVVIEESRYAAYPRKLGRVLGVIERLPDEARQEGHGYKPAKPGDWSVVWTVPSDLFWEYWEYEKDLVKFAGFQPRPNQGHWCQDTEVSQWLLYLDRSEHYQCLPKPLILQKIKELY